MKYSKENLVIALSRIDWEIESDLVQGCWDEIENKITNVVDLLAHMVEFTKNSATKSMATPPQETTNQ
jgi:hypothetical protein